LQRHREALPSHQRLLEPEQHHVIATRLELHLASCGHVDRLDLLHLHHVALMHMGVQLGLFGT